jgi:glycosyltransferase involved in cell wall biosynthesis
MLDVLQRPLVSIITPSFNSGNFIERCIQSVLAQNYPAIEHIVVDGGSKDSTLSIIEKYNDKLRWISEPDRGQSNAMNKGIRMAKGEIIGWINADDYYLPGAVQAVVGEFVACSDVSMVHGDAWTEDLAGRILQEIQAGEVDSMAILTRNQVCYPAFVRKVVFDEIGGFDETLHLSMDYEMWIRIVTRFKTKHVPVQIAAVTLHPQTKSIFRSYDMTIEAIKVKLNYLNTQKIKNLLGDDHPRLKQFSVWELGWFNYQSLDLKEARKWLIQTILVRPISVYSLKAFVVLLISLLGKYVSRNIVLLYHYFLNPIAKSLRKFSRYLRGKPASFCIYR